MEKRLLLTVALSSCGLLSASPIYTAINLGTLGGAFSGASGINASGHVVGSSTTASGQYRAFVYIAGTMIDLGTLGGSQSYGKGINASGQVTGSADTLSGETHAFLSTGGAMVDLGTLGGTLSLGQAINGSGQITGYVKLASGLFHAFLYSGGAMIDLGTNGGNHSYGFAINNAGQVTGSNSLGDSVFLYSGGTMTDLGFTGNGIGINASGQIVGTGYSPTGQGAFLYTGGSIIRLTPPGLSAAYGINTSGQVVGYSNSLNQNRDHRAFLYTNAALLDLTTLVSSGLGPGVYLTQALDINDNGWIVANGNDDRAYLLIPQSAVPEPASAALLGLGLAVLVIAHRRRIDFRA